MDDFDDFGIDLCPAPEAMVSESDQEFSKKNCASNEKENIAASRYNLCLGIWYKLVLHRQTYK